VIGTGKKKSISVVIFMNVFDCNSGGEPHLNKLLPRSAARISSSEPHASVGRASCVVSHTCTVESEKVKKKKREIVLVIWDGPALAYNGGGVERKVHGAAGASFTEKERGSG